MLIEFEPADGHSAEAPDSETATRSNSPLEASGGDCAELRLQRLLSDLQTICLRIPMGALGASWYSAVFPDIVRDQLQMFFSDRTENQLGRDTYLDARLKILSSIGLVHRNSESLLFHRDQLLGLDLPVTSDYKFSLQELEALFWPVQSSSMLEELWLQNQNVFITEESWSVLATIIRTVKTVRSIFAFDAGLRASNLVFLAEAVEATHPSSLSKLDVMRNLIFDKTGAECLVRILRAAPNLMELGVGPFEDEVGAKHVGNAVASHQRLETLFLHVEGKEWKPLVAGDDGNSHPQVLQSKLNKEPKKTPTDHFLDAAFRGLQRNVSIRYLCCSFSSWRLGALPQILAENSHISHFTLASVGNTYQFRSWDWQNLFKSLQMNSSIQRLHIENRIGLCETGGVGLDKVAFASLVDLLKSNTALVELTLFIEGGIKEGVKMADFEWPSFYRALGSNSTIRTLHLVGDVLPPNAENEFLNWIGTTTSLNRFTFYSSGAAVPWSSVFKALRHNSSLNVFKYEAVGTPRCTIDVLQPKEFGELVAMLQVNSTLTEISLDNFSSDQEASVREALRSESRHETYLVACEKD